MVSKFTEMLRRLPSSEESTEYTSDLITYQYTADEVRRRLMRHLENGIYIISIIGRNGLTYHGKVIKA